MTDAARPRGGSGEPDALEDAKYLWEEYRYRHDMVWKLVFRVTAVATALLIAPFLADEKTQDILGGWLMFLPILAIAVILLGFWALQPELKLLEKVRMAYRSEQNRALRHIEASWWTPHVPPVTVTQEPLAGKVTWWQELGFGHRGHFATRVQLFLLLMFVAATVFLVLFVVAWLPQIR